MNFKEFLQEAKGTFRDTAKYTAADFAKWQTTAKDIYNYDKQGDLILIYKDSTHIGTFDKKKNVIMGNNLELFGN